jgi:single-strand DNA-binding protein
MNEITVHGNVTADLELRYGRNGAGTAFTSFSVAVNRGYFDRARNARIEQPTVFHQVVAFGALAENAAETLRKGTTVTVTGQIADDSYTPDGWDKPIRRHRLEAADIAVSLRWATAQVTRRSKTQDSPAGGGGAEAGA